MAIKQPNKNIKFVRYRSLGNHYRTTPCGKYYG